MYLLTMFGSAPMSVLAANLTGISHPLNWTVGWSLILVAFIVGAILGLRTHRDDFLGGYTSYRRRMVRLGHIALAALGGMNVLFSLSPQPMPGVAVSTAASTCLIARA